jgi:hypothetical protein
MWFVGCSAWDPNQTDRKHRLFYPRNHESQEILQDLINGKRILGAVGKFESCFVIQPRANRTQFCSACSIIAGGNASVLTWFPAQIHFLDGAFVNAEMLLTTCPAIRRVWELYPKEGEPRPQKLLVLFEKHHSHPAIPEHKLSLESKNAIHSIVKQAGDGASPLGV